jgi:hypothetical protein
LFGPLPLHAINLVTVSCKALSFTGS